MKSLGNAKQYAKGKRPVVGGRILPVVQPTAGSKCGFGSRSMNLACAAAIYAGGPGSGCHGENCGRPSGAGGDRIKDRYKEAGVEMPRIFYAVKHKSQYEGDVNVEFHTSVGMYFQRGETTKDAKDKFFDWYLKNELQKRNQK